MASVDILYIDITRRWSCAVPDSREAGNKHIISQSRAFEEHEQCCVICQVPSETRLRSQNDIKKLTDVNYSVTKTFQITWTRIEGHVPRRLDSEFQMSSSVFRETKGRVIIYRWGWGAGNYRKCRAKNLMCVHEVHTLSLYLFLLCHFCRLTIIAYLILLQPFKLLIIKIMQKIITVTVGTCAIYIF